MQKKRANFNKTVVTTEFHNVFKSLAIFKHEGYSVVKFQTLGLKPIRTSLIFKRKNGSIPDSLQNILQFQFLYKRLWLPRPQYSFFGNVDVEKN
jgi:hypothetical protein